MSKDQNPEDNGSAKSMFDRWNADKRARRVIGAEDSLTAQRTETSKHLIEDYSARQLSKMADEIKEIVDKDQNPNSEFSMSNSIIEIPKHRKRFSVDLTTASIFGDNRGGAAMTLLYRSDRKTAYGQPLGIDAKFELRIYIHNDQESQDAINELYRREPSHLKLTQTIYYFDEGGNFAKVSILPKNLPDARIPLQEPTQDVLVKAVKSEMTPSDFELAGSALKAILNDLYTHFPQTPEP